MTEQSKLAGDRACDTGEADAVHICKAPERERLGRTDFDGTLLLATSNPTSPWWEKGKRREEGGIYREEDIGGSTDHLTERSGVKQHGVV